LRGAFSFSFSFSFSFCVGLLMMLLLWWWWEASVLTSTNTDHHPPIPTITRLGQLSAATPARKVVVIEGTEFVIDPRYEVTR
jgi:hypothetical protein